MNAYTAPGPGPWMLDSSHFTRPLTRYVRDAYTRAFTEGQASWMERYGAPMKTVRLETVEGYPYVQPVPLLGAPGGSPPPAFVMRLLGWVVPTMRACRAKAARALETRQWRIDAAQWRTETCPELARRFRAIQEVDPGSLEDGELLRHLETATDALLDNLRFHFDTNGATMIPTGMLLEAVIRWIGASPAEVLAAIGASGGVRDEVTELLDAVWQADAAQVLAALDGAKPSDALTALREREDALGQAVRAWLEYAEPRQIWAGDVHQPIGAEVPQLLVEQLRAHPSRAVQPADVADPAAELRARVPERLRERFDSLLDEARSTAFMRDERCARNDAWAGGLVRRALLEVGQRLFARGKLLEPGHVVHLRAEEIAALLDGADGPGPARVAEWAEAQRRTADHMPQLLNGPAGALPPPDAFPGELGEMMRGLLTYIDLMDREGDGTHSNERVLEGMGASGGTYTGVARVVDGAADFLRVKPGDVLVARSTMPTYNGVLALAGAVVTDRGGVLSHAAIVSRELGIPSVVGTRSATRRIPDGARVRVDGDHGRVELL